MWSQVSGGQVLRVLAHPIPLVIGDTQYPKNIFTLWSKAELKVIGIMPYREVPVDTNYHYSGTVSYEITEDEVVGSYASQSDKEYAKLKLSMLDKTKSIASSLLARDDWMAVRASEGGTAIPDAVKAYRVAVRKESNDKETAIKALGDLDAVKLYEATPYIETRKDDDDKEYESERHLDLVNHYFAEDPLAKDDPSFVSLVKK
tara:strand:- start:2014 stop:2622 length:609 start_codon:yes stop_codon:yes gene_type:complete